MPPKKREPAKVKKNEWEKTAKVKKNELAKTAKVKKNELAKTAKVKTNEWEKKILQELQKRRLREEALKRELAATEKNYKVVENNWRQILKKAEALKIKEDAEEAWRKFQHTVDIKDQVIALLREALDQEEEQKARSQICQSEAVKQLLDIYVDRLTDLRQRNQVLVKKLCATARTTMQEEMQRSHEEAEHQHVIAYITEMTQIENDFQCEAEIYAKLDDRANKFEAQIQQMCATLEKKLERIWHQILSVVAEYQERTADLHKAYLTLKKKNEKNEAEIHGYSERTQSLQLLIKNMQDKDRKNKEKLASLDGLNEERKDFIDVYSRLRDFLRQDREGDAKRLTDLVLQSNESLEWLEHIEKKGERILCLAKLCQHRQTEFETLIANGQIHFTEEMIDKLSELRREIDLTHDQPTVKEAVETCDKLANFWCRVGRAQITRNALAEEWKSLKTQNTILRIQLYNSLTGLHSCSVSEQAINQHTGTEGVVVVEASHMYNNNLVVL